VLEEEKGGEKGGGQQGGARFKPDVMGQRRGALVWDDMQRVGRGVARGRHSDRAVGTAVARQRLARTARRALVCARRGQNGATTADG
jgi:hypothetical protein